MHDGVIRSLTNVRYVPDLRRNLISLGLFDSMGYKFTSQQGQMTVSKDGKIVITGVKRNELYFLVGSTITGQAQNASMVDTTYLWHSRLPHVGEKGLHELEKQGLLLGDKMSKLQMCEHFIYGKSKRKKFTAATHSTKGILEYAHSDLWDQVFHVHNR